MFLHLRTHTAYSLSEGAIRVKELPELCAAQNMPAVGITDSNNLFGALEIAMECAKNGIQPIIGIQVQLEEDPGFQPEQGNNSPFMGESENAQAVSGGGHAAAKNSPPTESSAFASLQRDSSTPPHFESSHALRALGDSGGSYLSGDFLLFAQNQTGYDNLLQLASDLHLKNDSMHKPTLPLAWLGNGSAEGLIALTGGTDGLLAKQLRSNRKEAAETLLAQLQALFPGRLYIELNRHQRPEDHAAEAGLIDLAMAHNVPLVATNNCLFPKKEMFEAQDALMCIAHGRYISEENRPRYTPEHYFKSQDEMKALFADIPEAIANTEIIARRCAIMPEPHAPMLPKPPMKEGRSEVEEFEAVAREGLKKRLAQLEEQLRIEAEASGECETNSPFMGESDSGTESGGGHVQDEDSPQEVSDSSKSPHRDHRSRLPRKGGVTTPSINPAPYEERLEYEMSVIKKMDFPGYFLIVSDFIRWAKEQDIPVGPGRGSGAGSVIAWAMEITDLDPLRFGLLFERFLNPERVSMPDFDIDFCQERRDEVIRYVQEKYGADRVAQIITFGKLQARAVLRDVGRVLQMPYGQVDRMSKMIPFNPLSPVTLQQAIEMDPQLRAEAKKEESVARLLDIGLKLEGLFRHTSTHAAGVVIGQEALTKVLPLYTDHRSPIPTTQYSMKYCETAGLVKFDFLGLKTLTVIQKAVELVNRNVAQLPPECPEARSAWGDSKCGGVEESRWSEAEADDAVGGQNEDLPPPKNSDKFLDSPVKGELLSLDSERRNQTAPPPESHGDSDSPSRGELDISLIPLNDPATYAMLARGDSTGVFQMESSGMKDALRKMRPDTIEDIIALISLYRPGPMDNIPTYIARKHGREKPDYLHPRLEEVLKETYGVIIYQEQVMEIAKILGGYSLGGADLLRRAMGKKIKEEMDEQRELFMEGAKNNGVDKAKAGEIFDLVAKFAGYGFNKSHAAAYALIGYQTAYLKANYPVEFLTASMNIDIGDTDKLLTFREEARRCGVDVYPPDVNISDAYFKPEMRENSTGSPLEGDAPPPGSSLNHLVLREAQPLDGMIPTPPHFELPNGNSGGSNSSASLNSPSMGESDSGTESGGGGKSPSPRRRAIRYALGALKGVSLSAMEALVKEREANGPFTDIFDLAGRCGSAVLNKKQLEGLTKSGALDGLHPNRAQLFEAATMLTRYAQAQAEERASSQVSLFGGDSGVEVAKPNLPVAALWSGDETIRMEYEAFGFYLNNHPLTAFKDALLTLRTIPINELETSTAIAGESTRIKIAGVQTKLTQRASNSGKRFAYIQLSDPTGTAEVACFDEDLLSEKRDIISGNEPLLVTAEARKDEGGVRLIAENIELLFDAAGRLQTTHTIHINAMENEALPACEHAVAQLADYLRPAENPDPRQRVLVEISLPHQANITIRLPQAHQLQPSDMETIRNLPQVTLTRRSKS